MVISPNNIGPVRKDIPSSFEDVLLGLLYAKSQILDGVDKCPPRFSGERLSKNVSAGRTQYGRLWAFWPQKSIKAAQAAPKMRFSHHAFSILLNRISVNGYIPHYGTA